ncbi:amino acid deaminase/aldolase [Antrihabitans sp. YC2-6]|uniref:amino acid deaminase/aldolase n=1 Tax=Antrihabitans sp. YC2-6 TaxID=2799498 RepID=UPI0018F3ADDF|nr:amino acid deaminase/aldolase [Antrihabitans sp. YC2-6]MBJ8344729.1 amino acid deaminase/aldolase [Antrihabitans sp. YC2-6]
MHTTGIDLTGPAAGSDYSALEAATAGLEPPFAVLDIGAVRANARDLVRRAGGKPIRLASKSIRSRNVIRAVLDLAGFEGILAFTLPEALWLAAEFDDVLVGYPTADTAALRRLAADPMLADRVTLMIDSAEHLDFIADAIGPDHNEIRICLDLDASLRLLDGRIHLGARRSPLHSVDATRELAATVTKWAGFRLVGVMSYEGQVAGMGDNAPGSPLRRLGIRVMQQASINELRERRSAVISAVRDIARLEFVNGGGTGSLETTSAETAITELAAGSGLYGPTLFDTYRAFHPTPAAFFVLSVVRRPTPDFATVLGGGWVASGAAGADRLPTPTWPEGLRLTGTEGAGEVQTPLTGAATANLAVGDRVWFRHTKAGELCERVDELVLVDGDRIVGRAPTYRGEGKSFL